MRLSKNDGKQLDDRAAGESVKGAKSPAPTARLRRAASPSGEVVFYTGAASFFRKKTPARLENTCSICYHWYTCQRAEPPFPLLWHWKRFNPFPFKHTRASPPPLGEAPPQIEAASITNQAGSVIQYPQRLPLRPRGARGRECPKFSRPPRAKPLACGG